MVFRAMALTVVAVALFTSCKKGCTDSSAENYDANAKNDDGSCMYAPYETGDTTINGEAGKYITGVIDENFTMDNLQPWFLLGKTWVSNGATLTIEEGATVKGFDNGATPAYLAIQQGAKINANGTAQNPIVLTSGQATPAAGDWGGIILNGYGILNVGQTAEGEGNTGTYGGNDNTDNSGTLRYVRVEYAGRLLSTDNEMNGFSFNGVGSATTLEYLQAYEGADDGFEWFGGAAQVKYAVSTKNADDSFDWTHGWQGKLQFAVVDQQGFGDKGFECDNLEANFAATPISNPMVSNVTVIGTSNDGGGVRLRHGTKGMLHNFIVTGYTNEFGARIDSTNSGAADPAGATYVKDMSLMFANSVVFGNGSDFTKAGIYVDPNDPKYIAGNNNSTATVTLTGYVGTDNSVSVDPNTALDSWFTSATYSGAVASGNDWTAGRTR